MSAVAASVEVVSPLMQLSREEVLAEIKRDYESNYFVNGSGDMNAYEEDCLFTDPFSGFRVGAPTCLSGSGTGSLKQKHIAVRHLGRPSRSAIKQYWFCNLKSFPNIVWAIKFRATSCKLWQFMAPP